MAFAHSTLALAALGELGASAPGTVVVGLRLARSSVLADGALSQEGREKNAERKKEFAEKMAALRERRKRRKERREARSSSLGDGALVAEKSALHKSVEELTDKWKKRPEKRKATDDRKAKMGRDVRGERKRTTTEEEEETTWEYSLPWQIGRVREELLNLRPHVQSVDVADWVDRVVYLWERDMEEATSTSEKLKTWNSEMTWGSEWVDRTQTTISDYYNVLNRISVSVDAGALSGAIGNLELLRGGISYLAADFKRTRNELEGPVRNMGDEVDNVGRMFSWLVGKDFETFWEILSREHRKVLGSENEIRLRIEKVYDKINPFKNIISKILDGIEIIASDIDRMPGDIDKLLVEAESKLMLEKLRQRNNY